MIPTRLQELKIKCGLYTCPIRGYKERCYLHIYLECKEYKAEMKRQEDLRKKFLSEKEFEKESWRYKEDVRK